MIRPFRLTRIAALIVANATIVPPGLATLQDQVLYAVRACRVTDPITGETTVSFDLRVAPPESVSGGASTRLAFAVRA